VAVLRVSSAKQQGLAELWTAVMACPRHGVYESDAQALLRRAQQVLAERFQDRVQHVEPVIERWKRRELDETQAADELLQVLIR
jgi:hypothetical protein